MKIIDKILNKDYFEIQKRVLNLSFETYTLSNLIFRKVIIFSLPILILCPFLLLLILNSDLPYYQLVQMEKSFGLAMNLFLMPIVAIFVHRNIILRDEKYESWHLIFGIFKKRYFKFVLNVIFFVFIYWGILMSFILIFSKTNISPFLFIMTVLPLALYVQARLSLCFPLIATNQKGWILKSFKLTKNLGLTLPIAYYIVVLPLVFFQAFVLTAITTSGSSLLSDVIPIYVISIIQILLKLYTTTLVAVFFSNVYLIVKEDQ